MYIPLSLTKTTSLAGNIIKKKRNHIKMSSSSNNNSSDEDSTENLLLSQLRATLKAETKPPKRELKAESDESQQLSGPPKSSDRKRRHSYSHNSNSNLSSRSHSNSVTSTLASHGNTMSSCSALSLTLTNTDGNMPLTQPLSVMHDIANSLIELSTVSVGGAGSGLFNEQSQDVEDAISYHLHNVLPSGSAHQTNDDEDAQLGIYSDASNDDYVIDVVRDASGSIQGESVDANEDNVHDEQEQEEEEADEAVEHGDDDEEEDENEVEDEDEDEEEEENDDNEATDDAEDSPAPDTEASDSDQDAMDAY